MSIHNATVTHPVTDKLCVSKLQKSMSHLVLNYEELIDEWTRLVNAGPGGKAQCVALLVAAGTAQAVVDLMADVVAAWNANLPEGGGNSAKTAPIVQGDLP